MPSTRSGASEAAEGEDALVGADVLEEAARQLAAEGAARKAAEGRVAELQRQLVEREPDTRLLSARELCGGR